MNESKFLDQTVNQLRDLKEKIPDFLHEIMGNEKNKLESRFVDLIPNFSTRSELDLGMSFALTEDELVVIQEDTGWSDEIIQGLQTMDQYAVLQHAGLQQYEVNGKACLLKQHIDPDLMDADGMLSNRERMARGLAPLDSQTGEPIELHHLGQRADSPLVELTIEEHRTGDYMDGKKNQSLWHDNTVDTQVHGEGSSWGQERQDYWKTRVDIAIEEQVP